MLMTLLAKLQVSTGFPVDHGFGRWILGFKQSSLHLVSQPLQTLLGYPSFASGCFADMLCSQLGFPFC